MFSCTIKEHKADMAPAYVANGMIGLRIGKNPLGGTALLNGYMGLQETERVEAYDHVPYPVSGDIRLNGLPLASRPDLLAFRDQTLDFATGELLTRFDFSANGVTAHTEVLTFCSRSMPTLTLQEIRVRVDKPCSLVLRAQVDPTGLRGRCLHRQAPNQGWTIAEGSLHWESAGGLASCGVAYLTQFLGVEGVTPRRDFWGHESALFSDYTVEAKPGQPYVLRQLTSLVPNIMHAAPDHEAIRLVRTGFHRGFDNLRADNRTAWAELWKSRVNLVGAEERWQRIADSAFYYLHSSVHPSNPCSVGPWGVGIRMPYMGHVFWDCETFTYPPVVLTAPEAARAMMDYRFKCLPAARNNAALNGYRGCQFPWQSGRNGDESLASWASAIFIEQHVSMDVAFAFAQYAHASGDELFMRQQAWPVLEGVSQWIASRVVETGRGYEIHNVTGIDESIENINNNGYINTAAIVILRETMDLARRLGYAVLPRWADIEKRMFIPLHPKGGYILKHDAYEYKDGVCYPELLGSFFPLGYQTTKEIEAATLKYYLDMSHTYMDLPMLISQVGVFAARQGNRKFATDLFEGGVARFTVEPFAQFIESIEPAVMAAKDRAVLNTPYMANLGGFLMACLYGLTGLQLGPGAPDTWCRHAPAMPSAWEGIEVERIWVRGAPARLTARQGDAKARIEQA